MQINILEYLENGAARQHPGKIAVADAARTYTFAELEGYAKRCATLLIRRADVTCRPVAVFLPKSANVVFADLGIVYSGNIYANLDVKSPAQRVWGILGNIAPILVITSRALAPRLTAIGVPDTALFFIEDIEDVRVQPDGAALWRRLEGVIDTDPLCIIHTSGSTGLPKGVVLSHRGTIDFMDWCFERLKLDGSERIGSLSPFHFDIYTLELNLCMAKGATLVIIPDPLAIFPAKLVEFLAVEAIGFIFREPSIMVAI